MTERRLMAPRAPGGQVCGKQSAVGRHRASFGGDEMLQNWMVVMVA